MTLTVSYPGAFPFSLKLIGRHLGLALAIAVACAPGLCRPAPVAAQGIQVIKGIQDSGSAVESRRTAQRERDLDEVLRTYRRVITLLADSRPNVRTAANEVLAAAERIIKASPHEALEPLMDAFHSKVGVLTDLDSGWDSSIERNLTPPLPPTFKAFPDVAFTLAYAFSFRKDSLPIHEVSVGTNLMGAALGGAFGAVGVKALQDYFVNNSATGFSLPASGSDKPSIDLGLGLGQIKLKKVRIWPVLGFQQIDHSDSRLPSTVASELPEQTTWSTPVLAIGIFDDPARARRKMQNGELIFIPAIGLQLPFYYPGNVFEALGALFSNKQGDYMKSGNIGITLSLSFPLLPTGS